MSDVHGDDDFEENEFDQDDWLDEDDDADFAAELEEAEFGLYSDAEDEHSEQWDSDNSAMSLPEVGEQAVRGSTVSKSCAK